MDQPSRSDKPTVCGRASGSRSGKLTDVPRISPPNVIWKSGMQKVQKGQARSPLRGLLHVLHTFSLKPILRSDPLPVHAHAAGNSGNKVGFGLQLGLHARLPETGAHVSV